MPFVIYATPFFSDFANQLVHAIADLPDMQLAVVSQAPEHELAPDARARIRGHWRVDDALNHEQLIWAVGSLQERVGQPVDILLAANEDIQVPAAHVRAHFGLPGPSVETTLNFRDKDQMKSVLRAAGLPCARHWRAATEAEVWAGVEAIGYPLVVKPVAGAGSQFTHRVSSDETMAAVLKEHAPEEKGPVLLEEFVQGEEFSYDTFVIDGEILWHSISWYLPSPSTSSNIRGSSGVSSSRSKSMHQSMMPFARLAIARWPFWEWTRAWPTWNGFDVPTAAS